MSPGLFLDNKRYISAKEASRISGYSQDYIGQLARAGKISSKRIGRNWYISEESILNYKDFANELGLVPEIPALPVESFLPELKKKPEPSLSCPEVKISKLDPACITIFTPPSVVPNPRTLPASVGKLLAPSLGIIFVGIILNANGVDLQKSFGKLLGNFGENLTANVSSTTPLENQKNLGSNLLAQALTQKTLVSPEQLRSAFKNFVSSPQTTTATSSPSSTTIIVKETVKEVPVKVISNSGLEVELRKLLANPAITSLFRGPRGSDGEDGETPDTSNLVTKDFLDGQIDVILDDAIDNPTEALEERLAESISTGELTVSGTGTFTEVETIGLSVSGEASFGDFVAFESPVEIRDTLGVTGIASFTHAPTLAHTFTTWPAGTSNYADASLVINPASAVADSNLVSASVNGSIKFLVDAEGDIYGNNLILTGSTSQGATSIAGNLDVQDHTTLGDSGADTITINGYVNSDVTFTKSDPALIFNSPTATDTDFWFGVQEDGGGDDDDVFQVGDSTTPGTNPFLTLNTSGNLGIGTTTPDAKLQIAGGGSLGGLRITYNNTSVNYFDADTNYFRTGAASETARLTATGLGLGGVNPINRLDVFGGVAIGAYGDGNNTAPTNGMIVSGNVGIGTTNPGSKLEVNLPIDSNVAFNAASSATAQGVNASGLLWKDAGTNAWQMYVLNSAASNSFIIDEVSGTRSNVMTLQTSGNVGIGTTSPTYKLHVKNTVGDPVAIFSAGSGTTDGNSGLRVVAPINTSHFNWQIGAQQNINKGFEITPSTAVGGTTFSTPAFSIIADTGNVGISTSNPQAKLQINAAAGTNALIFKNTTASGNQDWTMYSSGATNSDLIFYDGGARMVLENGGNVGIGNTDPGALLHLGANQATTDLAQLILNDDANFRGEFGYNESGNTVMHIANTYNSDSARFDIRMKGSAAANAVMTILGSGNVGIGDSTPSTLLEVAGNIRNSQHNVFTEISNDASNGYIGTGSNHNLGIMTNGSVRMTLETGGDVGIGTTNPGAKLEVNGAAQIATQLAIGYNNGGGVGGATMLNLGTTSWPAPGSTNQYGISGNNITFSSAATSEMAGISFGIATPNASFTTADVTGLAVNGINKGASHTITRSWGISINDLTSATNNALLFLGGGSNLGTTFTGNWAIYNNSSKNSYLGTGNIAIGTTSPFSKLTVQGSSGSGIIDTTSGDTTLIDADLVGQFGFRSIDADGHVGGDQLLGYMAGVIEDNGGDNIFAGSQDEGMGIAFYTSGLRPSSNAAFTPAERMRITKAGNVGIGSTTAGVRLEIKSNAVNDGILLRESYVGNSSLFQVAQNNGDGTGATLNLADGNGTNVISLTSGTGNSYFNGSGNVGIGTTNPNALLHIKGTGATYAIIDSSGANSLGRNIQFNNQAGNGVGYVSFTPNTAGTNSTMDFYVGNGTGIDMRIQDNGNVGIGTTTTNFSGLGIDHTVLTVGNSAAGMGLIELAGYRTSDADLGRLSFGNQGTRLAEIYASRIDADNSAKLSFVTTDAGSMGIRMTISKTGNVGIGRTSPSAKLDVNSGGVAYPSINVETMGIFSNNGSGGANAYLSLISGNTGNTAIFFGDSDSQTPGQIAYNNNTNAMTVTVNASTAMTILSSGNVGLGSATNPSTLLQLSHATDPTLTITDTTNTVNTLVQSGNTSGFIGTGSAHSLNIGTNGSGRLVIDSSGNFVFNEDGNDSDFRIESDTNANIFKMDAGNNNLGFGAAPNSRYFADFGGAGSHAFTSPATGSDESSYVLIRPASVANTAGTGALTNMTIAGTSLNPVGASTIGASLFIDAPSEGGAGSIANMATVYIAGAPTAGTSGNAALAVASGNVGIGTTNPSALLHTYKSTTGETEGLRLTNPGGTAGDSVALTMYANDQYAKIAAVRTATNAGVDTVFSALDGSGVLQERMRILEGGNVGIGTTNPQYLLHLNVASATGVPRVQFTNSDTGVTDSDGAFVGLDALENMYILNFESTNMHFGTSGSTKMTILSGGNIGIGTTNPSAPLHVESSNGEIARLKSTAANGSYASFYKDTSSVMFWGGRLAITGTGGATDGIIAGGHNGDGGHLFIYGNYNVDSSGMEAAAGVFRPILDNAMSTGDGSHRWSAVYAVNGAIQTSDEREKHNIFDTELGLDFINKLRPVQYEYNDIEGVREGFIAQEVLVALDGNPFEGGIIYNEDTDRYGLNYAAFVAPLTKAVQELDEKIEAMTGDGLAGIDGFWDSLLEKFEDFGITITSTFTRFNNLFAEDIHIENQLCVDDVCINKNQLKALLIQAGASQGNNNGSNSDNDEVEPGDEEIVEEEPAPEEAEGGSEDSESNEGNEETPEEESAPEEEPVVEEPPAEEPAPEETP